MITTIAATIHIFIVSGDQPDDGSSEFGRWAVDHCYQGTEASRLLEII